MLLSLHMDMLITYHMLDLGQLFLLCNHPSYTWETQCRVFLHPFLSLPAYGWHSH